MTPAFHQPVVCPILIGRTHELAALYTALDQVKTGQGHLILLSGEAGVGKSRLVAETSREAAHQGFLLLQGNCFQADQSFPYAPFLDLLHTCFVSLVDAHELSTLAGELARYLPDVIPLLPQNTTSIAPSHALEPHQEKRRLFTLLHHFFSQLATRQPLVLVLEDLHWCDDISLELLHYLARRCNNLPLLFVLTYRNDEVTPELQHVLAEFDREHLAQDIVLQQLNQAEVAAMLQTIFNMHQASPTGLEESLYELTEGNPFFIEEVLKSLLTTGEIINSEGKWERTLLFGTHRHKPSLPRSVQDAVYQRTRHLSEPARQLLTLAAVAGRRFNLPILQQIMDVDETYLLRYMKELIAAQLVKEEGTELFAFRHALTRQAVYTQLLIGERRALHRHIGETIEQAAFPSSVLDAQLVDLAYHFFQGEVWSKAAEYGQRAGERARILYAPRSAIEHFTRTLDALRHLHTSPTPSLLRARGQAYETTGAFEQARADYTQALAIAQQTQDGSMEWQSLLDLGFLWAGRDYTQAGHWFRRSLEHASTLADPRLHARSLNRLGNWFVNTGRPEEGLQAHQQALAIVETLQDTQAIAETFDLLGMAYGIHGDTVRAVEEYKRAIALLRTLQDRQGLSSSLTTLVIYTGPFFLETTCSTYEPLEPCSHLIMEALDLAQQLDSPVSQAYTHWIAGGFFASAGDFGRGLTHARQSLRIAAEIKHTQWIAGAHFTLGRISLYLLQATQAIQSLEEGLQLARDMSSSWWIGNITAYLAYAYILQGTPSRARKILEAAMPCEQLPKNSPERRMSWAWGELALAENQAETALKIADRLLASTPGTTRSQPIPWLLKLKGEALAKLSRRKEAIEVLEQARSGAIARQETPVLWHIHCTLGRLHRQLKQQELAQDQFRAAREIITSLAHTLTDEYLREQFTQTALLKLPKARPSATSASRTAKSAFGGLTEREREIASLIAQGKSNGEIADSLIVTRRTIETHINNILTKLGYTTRAQIILWAIEKGLTKS